MPNLLQKYIRMTYLVRHRTLNGWVFIQLDDIQSTSWDALRVKNAINRSDESSFSVTQKRSWLAPLLHSTSYFLDDGYRLWWWHSRSSFIRTDEPSLSALAETKLTSILFSPPPPSRLYVPDIHPYIRCLWLSWWFLRSTLGLTQKWPTISFSKPFFSLVG